LYEQKERNNKNEGKKIQETRGRKAVKKGTAKATLKKYRSNMPKKKDQDS
jgi:hypothetical protein